MKRKAKTITLIGLGSIVALGLVYWRFSPVDSSVVRRSRTDIFAEAFAKHEFKRCYLLMADDYRARIPQSEFVENWETLFSSLHHAGYPRFQESIQLTSPGPNEVSYAIRYSGLTARRPVPLTPGTNQTIIIDARIVLHLSTRHGDTIISDLSIDTVSLQTPIRTPMRDRGPIS